jgi:hypothetical protein
MSAKPITLEIKKTTCNICANSDKRALRQKRPCCQATNPRNNNGHCSEFKSIKPKFLIQKIGHPAKTSGKWTGDCPDCSYIATGSTKKAVQGDLENHYTEEHRS